VAKKGAGSKKGANLKNSQSLVASDLLRQYRTQDQEFLQEFAPDLSEELCEAILQELGSRLLDLREEAAKAIFMESDAKKKFQGTEWQTEVQKLYANIYLFSTCAANFSGTPAQRTELDKHLLRTLCGDMLNLLLEAAASQQMLNLGFDEINTIQHRKDALKVLQQKFPKVSQPLHQLNETLTRTTSEFLEASLAAVDVVGVRVKPLDKKSERTLVDTHIISYCEQFDIERAPANAFQVGVLLLYAIKTRSVLHIPSKLVMDVLQSLQSSIVADVYSQLTKYGEDVKEYIAAKIKNQPNQGDLLLNLDNGLEAFKAAVNTEKDKRPPK